MCVVDSDYWCSIFCARELVTYLLFCVLRRVLIVWYCVRSVRDPCFVILCGCCRDYWFVIVCVVVVFTVWYCVCWGSDYLFITVCSGAMITGLLLCVLRQ